MVGLSLCKIIGVLIVMVICYRLVTSLRPRPCGAAACAVVPLAALLAVGHGASRLDLEKIRKITVRVSLSVIVLVHIYGKNYFVNYLLRLKLSSKISSLSKVARRQKTPAFAEVKRLSVKKSRECKRNRSKIIAIDYSATLQAYLTLT